MEDFDFLRSKKRNPQPTLINSQTKSLHIIGFTEENLSETTDNKQLMRTDMSKKIGYFGRAHHPVFVHGNYGD